jgi:solute carrier family 39 (zinc transporter), member 9
MHQLVPLSLRPANSPSRSFLAGLLPLSFSLTPSQLRLISTIGMGVLIGTSLIVIIPEGVDSLYSASLTGNAHVKKASNGGLSADVSHEAQFLSRRKAGDLDVSFMPGPVLPGSNENPPPTPARPGMVGAVQNDEDKKSTGDDTEGSKAAHRHKDSPHAWIGVALIAGFILMYLIDKLPQCTASTNSTAQPHHISLNDLGRGLSRAPSPNQDSEADGFLQDKRIGQGQGRSFATTTGLVIHAAADGIALGASSSSASAGLSLVIFLAIMVHKAPAAFGLTSVLLKQGLPKRTARAHLLLFSLAAPTGAILTWLFAHTLGAGVIGNAHNTKWWTGMLLLFSGGTFLYVAMHTMQEVGSSHDAQLNGRLNGFSEGRDTQPQLGKPLPRDLMAAVIGMMLPLFLQIGHAH